VTSVSSGSGQIDFAAEPIILRLNSVDLLLLCVAAPKSFAHQDEVLLRPLPFGEFGVIFYSHISSIICVAINVLDDKVWRPTWQSCAAGLTPLTAERGNT